VKVWPAQTRHAYHSSTTDLSVARAQAAKRAEEGEETIIHLHLHGKPCPGEVHETYNAEQQVSPEVRNGESGLVWQ
jgi:hypothetical protein